MDEFDEIACEIDDMALAELVELMEDNESLTPAAEPIPTLDDMERSSYFGVPG